MCALTQGAEPAIWSRPIVSSPNAPWPRAGFLSKCGFRLRRGTDRRALRGRFGDHRRVVARVASTIEFMAFFHHHLQQHRDVAQAAPQAHAKEAAASAATAVSKAWPCPRRCSERQRKHRRLSVTDREEDEAARAAVLRATPACDSVHGCARGGARERAPGDGRIEPTLASYPAG